ncbi:MAG: hypothetical protein FJ279_25980, partial [Planctomycetes bacterium]|nr:hypothetical protein [Planctomycetota bacterium]
VADASHPILADVLGRWPGFGRSVHDVAFLRVSGKTGAQVLARVPQEVAGGDVPFLVANGFGQGRCVLFNSLWTYEASSEFLTWRYAPRFLGQMVRWAAGLPPPAQKKPLPDLRAAISYGGRWHGYAEPEKPSEVRADDLPRVTFALDAAIGSDAEDAPVSGPPQVKDAGSVVDVRFANGVGLRFHKAGMIELTSADGVRLTAPPVDELPQIVASGAEPAELLQDVGDRTAEFQILKKPINPGALLAASYEYLRVWAQGSGVVFEMKPKTTDGRPALLRWRFTPRSVRIEGEVWHGLGDQFELVDEHHFIDSVQGKYAWRIGDTGTDDRTMRLSCYGYPRGYYELDLAKDADSDANNRWGMFSSGQPFQVLGGKEGTLFLYFDEATNIRAGQRKVKGRDCIYFDHQVVLGRVRGRVTTPIQWMLFSPQPLTENLWMALYDHVKRHYERRYDVKPTAPVPSAMMRFEGLATHGAALGRNVAFRDALTYRGVADYFLPLAKRLGFRRVDLGTLCGPDVSPQIIEQHGGQEQVKYLVSKARELGLEPYVYWLMTLRRGTVQCVLDHPGWLVRQRDGKPFTTPDGWINLSLRSGWYEYSIADLKRAMTELGVAGVWFDSLAPAMDAVNFAEPEPRPVVEAGCRYFRDLRKMGFGFWVEGQHPLALESYWYRKEKYGGPFEGREFCLFNSSLWSQGRDSVLFLDPFKLVSFRAPMVVDIRELADEDDPLTRRQARCNRLFNAVSDALGPIRAVRKSDFGSVWVAERGYAFFGHQSVRLSLTGLPNGNWQVLTPEGRGSKLALSPAGGEGMLMAEDVIVLCRAR